MSALGSKVELPLRRLRGHFWEQSADEAPTTVSAISEERSGGGCRQAPGGWKPAPTSCSVNAARQRRVTFRMLDLQ